MCLCLLSLRNKWLCFAKSLELSFRSRVPVPGKIAGALRELALICKIGSRAVRETCLFAGGDAYARNRDTISIGNRSRGARRQPGKANGGGQAAFCFYRGVIKCERRAGHHSRFTTAP